MRPASKKDTARIPLEAAKPRMEKPVVGPGDSNVRAAVQPPAAKATRLGETAVVTVASPMASVAAAAEKRKTSRISLEAVLGDSAGEAEGGGPKTIKLKRPGESVTAKAGAPTTEDGAVGGPAAATGGSPTQKKTVIVRRQADSAAGRKLTFARPQGQGGEAASTGPGSILEMTPVAQVHWLFPALAVLAMVCSLTLVYMLSTQALESGGANLAWPGKISGN